MDDTNGLLVPNQQEGLVANRAAIEAKKAARRKAYEKAYQKERSKKPEEKERQRIKSKKRRLAKKLKMDSNLQAQRQFETPRDSSILEDINREYAKEMFAESARKHKEGTAAIAQLQTASNAAKNKNLDIAVSGSTDALRDTNNHINNMRKESNAEIDADNKVFVEAQKEENFKFEERQNEAMLLLMGQATPKPIATPMSTHSTPMRSSARASARRSRSSLTSSPRGMARNLNDEISTLPDNSTELRRSHPPPGGKLWLIQPTSRTRSTPSGMPLVYFPVPQPLLRCKAVQSSSLRAGRFKWPETLMRPKMMKSKLLEPETLELKSMERGSLESVPGSGVRLRVTTPSKSQRANRPQPSRLRWRNSRPTRFPTMKTRPLMKFSKVSTQRMKLLQH